MKFSSRRHSVAPKIIKNINFKHFQIPSKGKGNISSDNSMDENTGFSKAGRKKFRGVQSERRRSIKLNMENSPATIKTKRNYMSLQSDELEDRNIVGMRKALAIKLQQIAINISVVVLIITY